MYNRSIILSAALLVVLSLLFLQSSIYRTEGASIRPSVHAEPVTTSAPPKSIYLPLIMHHTTGIPVYPRAGAWRGDYSSSFTITSDNKLRDLKIAVPVTGGTCHISEGGPVPLGRVGLYTSLKMDAAGRTHISYFDDSNGDLKYALWDGVNWRNDVVDQSGTVGMYTSLALDHAGRPHISYYDSTKSDLKYAHWDGAQWVITTVDSAGDVGRSTSLALDSADHPHISYTNRTLK